MSTAREDRICPTKRCPRCRQSLPMTMEHWYRRVDSEDGLQPYCKPCKRAKAAEWQSASPTYYKTYSVAYRKAKKQGIRTDSEEWFFTRQKIRKVSIAGGA